MGRFKIKKCQSDVFQLGLTIHPASRLSHDLHCREQHPHQDSNDCNGNDEFDQRKSAEPIFVSGISSDFVRQIFDRYHGVKTNLSRFELDIGVDQRAYTANVIASNRMSSLFTKIFSVIK